MTKVLLINAPVIHNPIAHRNTYFPLAILSIATFLRQEQIDATVLDAGNEFAQKHLGQAELADYVRRVLIDHIGRLQPDVIGIGAVFSGAFGALQEFAKAIKASFPNMPIVIGGIHATIFAKEVLERFDYIDFVIVGEGEYSFLELVKCISSGGSVDEIDGLAFRRSGEVRLNPKLSFIADLDALPATDYDLIDLTQYQFETSGWYSPKQLPIGQPFPVISSRSCPNRCSFCSMWLVHGPRFRARSAKHVVDELESLYNKYGVRFFEFMDDNLTFDKARTLDICNDILKRNLNIQFSTPNGVAINRLDEETVDALVAAGLIRVALAVEHGSEYIRIKVMRKPLDTARIYQVAEACAKHKQLYIIGYFVIGMPQETQETLDATFKIITELPLDHFQLNWATPYPGTELFRYCMEHKLLAGKPEDYMTSEHLHYNTAKPHFKPHDLTIEELVAFKDRCFGYLKDKKSALGVAYHLPMRGGGDC
jgi:magnesium-protoporphyrin IX monomethyl ester (oxidative) cyclase